MRSLCNMNHFMTSIRSYKDYCIMGYVLPWFAILFLSLFALSVSVQSALAETATDSTTNQTRQSATSSKLISFDEQVRPILAKHCLACHGGVKQAGGLNMVWQEGLLGESDSGHAVLPGKADDSELIYRITEEDEDIRMPPPEHGGQLNASEIETLRDWINQGAHWELPWAFVAPSQQSVPKHKENDWPRTDIDQFVLNRMKQAALSPSHEATSMAWLRRVSFDLIGLPPNAKEREAFKADLAEAENKEGAYQATVERLLASPHFGERWASVWLDLARYADTSGYEKDTHRDIWPYRDWVIRAFNEDKPYDDFLVDQLAGDLLPDASIANQVATAFHRNTQTNKEGGTDDEEFRIAAVLDRVDTTWQAIQGLTFACARCHDHPYDPISQEEYYQFYAGLNSTRDLDLDEEFPKLKVPNDLKQWDRAAELDKKIATIRKVIYERGESLTQDNSQWQDLKIDQAKSTGDTELSLVPFNKSINGSASSGTEVVASGTITDKSFYTLSAPAPEGTITAIRVDALPKDIDEALKLPEIGFVLSRLRLFVDRADGSEEEVYFHSVFSDEAFPFFAADESISDTQAGWAAYSRIIRPRWAIFVLDRQVDGQLVLAKGDRLRFTLKHGKNLDGQGALVLRRFRLATTKNRDWKDHTRDQAVGNLRLDAAELNAKRNAIKSTAVPILEELPVDKERPNYLFERGNFLVKGKRLTPGLPQMIGESMQTKISTTEPEENRRDSQEVKTDRLATARWIASESNPLTSRVWVNRVWQELLGQGLVNSLDDFGTTGTRPTHPELLDHMAIEFVSKHHWQLKSLLREIVLSATYRQDAKASKEALQVDPTNQWLSHGPRQRLRAEMVRDQALTLSGEFNPKRFGKPVMPYQPEGVWQSVYNNQNWVTSKDDNRFRRAIYTYWKRSSAYPSMRTFDAPSRELCTSQRPTTNTPLQALALLNDAAYHELAEGFASQMLKQGGATIPSQVAWGYEEATNQIPSEAIIEELSQLYHDALDEISIDQTAKQPPQQAMTIVASALLNLDATLNN